MSDIKNAIENLNEMVLQGQMLDAFEKYYADDVVMHEGTERFAGKDLNHEREKAFFGSITEFRGAEVKGVTIGDDVTMVEWHFDYTHAEWGDMKYDQVAVQRWRNGEIVDERFYKAT